MTHRPNQSPLEWFQQSAKWYVEHHQGCVHCGGSHCVFYSDWCQRIEYYCAACDFLTCHDLQTDRYHAAVGDGRGLLGAVLDGDAT